MNKRKIKQQEVTAKGPDAQSEKPAFDDPARIASLTATFESPTPPPTWSSRCLSSLQFLSLVSPILLICGLAILLLRGAGVNRIELDAQVARMEGSLKRELDQQELRDAQRITAVESQILKAPAITELLQANTTALSESLKSHHATLFVELKGQLAAQQNAQQNEAREKQVASEEFVNQIIATVDSAITSKLQSHIDREPQKAAVAATSLSVFWIPASQKNALDAQLVMINALHDEAGKISRPFKVFVAANDQYAEVLELPISSRFTRPQIGANPALWYSRAKLEMQRKQGAESILIAGTDHRPDVLVEFPIGTKCLVVEAEPTGVDQERLNENKEEWQKLISTNSQRAQFIVLTPSGRPTQLSDPLSFIRMLALESPQSKESNTGIRP